GGLGGGGGGGGGGGWRGPGRGARLGWPDSQVRHLALPNQGGAVVVSVQTRCDQLRLKQESRRGRKTYCDASGRMARTKTDGERNHCRQSRETTRCTEGAQHHS